MAPLLKRIPMKMRKSTLKTDRHAGFLALALILLLAWPVSSFAQSDENILELTINAQATDWTVGEEFVIRAVLKNTGSQMLVVDVSGDLGESYYMENAGSKTYPFQMWANYGVPCEDEAPRLKTFSPNDFVTIRSGQSYTKRLHCKIPADRLKSLKSLTFKSNHVRYFTSWVLNEKFIGQAERAFPNAKVFRTTQSVNSNVLPIRIVK